MEIWWLEQSISEIPADDNWLAPGEKLRIDTLRFPKRRADWRLGRWTAKRAISAYLGLHADPGMLSRIEINSAASGAPEVFLDNVPAEVSISITHRAGIAACAIAPPEMTIGCDLELIELRSDAFLADYFTAGEQSLVIRGVPADRAVTSTLLWSAKESALKALKVGLRFDTRSVEVSVSEIARPATGPLNNTLHAATSDVLHQLGNWHSLTVSHEDGQSFHGWWLWSGTLVRTLVSDPPADAPRITALH